MDFPEGVFHMIRNTRWGGGGLPDLLRYYHGSHHDNHVNLLMIMKMFFQWVAPAEGVSPITLVNTSAPGIHHDFFCTRHLSLVIHHSGQYSCTRYPSSSFLHTSAVYNFITLHYSVFHAINLNGTPHHNHLIAPGAPPRKQDNNVIDNNNNHLIDPSRCLT